MLIAHRKTNDGQDLYWETDINIQGLYIYDIDDPCNALVDVYPPCYYDYEFNIKGVKC